MKQITKHQLFQRQTTLTEFGERGQQKLQHAKVLIIGCGGLGNSAAVYLATSGIGQIHLIDFDVIDVSNLHRQVFFKSDEIGKSKAEILARYIEQIAPFTEISFSNNAISKSNIFETISDFDIVLDCTDSLPIKYLINDACVLKDKILIYGSLYKFDGYIASFNTLDSEGNRTTNLRDAFPEIPKISIPNCSEAGTLNTIVGIIGLMQANEVIKIVSEIGKPLANQLQIYNSLDNSQFNMKLKNSFSKERIQSIFDVENYTDINCQIQDENLLISAEKLREKILNQENFKILSVIEDMDTELPFEVDLKVPLSTLELKKIDFKNNKEIVVICNQGISSYIATQKIKKTYPNLKVLSLKNGITQY